MSAYENIITRFSGAGAAAIAKYIAVGYNADGLFTPATSSVPFEGIVQYGSEAAGNQVTVVKGVFPAYVTGAVVAGDKLTIDDTAAGKFKKVTGYATPIYGIALTDGDAGDLVSVRTLEVSMVTEDAPLAVPGAPEDVTLVSKTATVINIFWALAAGVASYNVYVDGAKVNVAAVESTYYSITALTTNTEYAVTVKAVNAAGESAASTALTVTTA